MSDRTTQEVDYDLESVDLPRLSGLPLRLFVALLESPLGGLLTPNLLGTLGLTRFREQEIHEPPTLYPVHGGALQTEQAAVPKTEWPAPPAEAGPGVHFATVRDYASAYREGRTTPEEIAHTALEAIESSDAAEPPLRAFIAVDEQDVLRQARDATRRIEEGQSLSPFDGVPAAVKDQIDMVPYPTTVGTSLLGAAEADQDAGAVARMRSAGALLLGKNNMHELGTGVTGLNPHHGIPRNPYAPGHYAGGSSSGSAAAVAAGLCPVAIAVDGGGSIRVPSSFCGLVGLKPTFGRVSTFGVAPIGWSVIQLGPLATTVTDAALAYAVLAGPDPHDPHSLHQPAPSLVGWDATDLTDLTLGVFPAWFRHATSNTVSICDALLSALERKGAEVQEIAIPGLEAGRVAHLITIGAEVAQPLEQTYAQHHGEHGLDTRVNLVLGREFTAPDYVRAQRVRTQMLETFDRALRRVDAVLTPTTGVPAPAIPDAALTDGDFDFSTLVEIIRFVTPANMTGLPAISFPAGYTDAGLPVGMQAIGRAWEEPTLLRLALAAERLVERQPPQIHYDLLTT